MICLQKVYVRLDADAVSAYEIFPVAFCEKTSTAFLQLAFGSIL